MAYRDAHTERFGGAGPCSGLCYPRTAMVRASEGINVVLVAEMAITAWMQLQLLRPKCKQHELININTASSGLGDE